MLEEGEGTLESEEISESTKSGGKNVESPKKGSQASELPDSPVFRMYLDEISGISLCTPEELQKLYGQLLEGNDSVIGKISENWMHRILEQVKKLSGGRGGFFRCGAGRKYGFVYGAFRDVRQ